MYVHGPIVCPVRTQGPSEGRQRVGKILLCPWAERSHQCDRRFQLDQGGTGARGFEQGPPWPDAVVANALGYDAMTIGNHEFDFGQVRLAEFIEGVDDDIPFITANLGFEGTALEELADAGRIAPSVVLERDGEQIGVIGLTSPDITSISSPGNVTIETDLAAVVNGQVAALQARGWSVQT